VAFFVGPASEFSVICELAGKGTVRATIHKIGSYFMDTIEARILVI